MLDPNHTPAADPVTRATDSTQPEANPLALAEFIRTRASEVQERKTSERAAKTPEHELQVALRAMRREDEVVRALMMLCRAEDKLIVCSPSWADEGRQRFLALTEKGFEIAAFADGPGRDPIGPEHVGTAREAGLFRAPVGQLGYIRDDRCKSVIETGTLFEDVKATVYRYATTLFVESTR